jgi:hypothetical protein
MIEQENNIQNSPSEISVYSDKDYDGNYDVIFNKLDDGIGIELVLPNDFNDVLGENEFSNNVYSIVFGDFYNKVIKKNTLPTKLKYLVFGDEFNKLLEPNVLPETLQSLTFGRKYNFELNSGVLPLSLLYLKFGEKYNKEFVQNSLPNSLIVLEFDKYSHFNKGFKKDILPQSLKKLTFGDEYNQKIKPDRLPSNLKYLIFGKNYGDLIKSKQLPNSLKYIELGYKYIHSLSNLPSSVEIVCFDVYKMPNSINWNLPNTVKKIIIKNIIIIGCDSIKISDLSNNLTQVQLINYRLDKDLKIIMSANCTLINKWGDKINIK